MNRIINVNFHQTFKPELHYISSILEIADGSSEYTLEEISNLTGIPQGGSSGKVEPHIVYSSYMGLISREKQNGKMVLTRTTLGETVLQEDSGLQEKVTLIVLHSMMLRRINGACIWSDAFRNVLPKYRDGITKERMIMELNTTLDDKVNAKNIGPFFTSYENAFSNLDVLECNGELYKTCAIPYDDECIYAYALALLEFWRESFPEQDEISSVELDTLAFGKSFGWDTQKEYEVLEYMSDRGFIRMNRQLMPYTILKLVDIDEIISLLYSELI